MITVDSQEAESRFLSLLTAVENDQETIVIYRDGKPVAELRPPEPSTTPLRVHPELSRVEFFEDPSLPVDTEDWPG